MTQAEATEADLPELTRRIAHLWAMVAELNPELASRLPAYCPEET